MKVFIRVLMGLILGLTITQAAAFEKTAKHGTTHVYLSSDKPLATGSNILILTLSEEGTSFADASVRVKAFMPAMPGMPAMESVSEALDIGNGKYEVRLNLAMSGTWQLHIFITPLKGKRLRVKSSLDF